MSSSELEPNTQANIDSWQTQHLDLHLESFFEVNDPSFSSNFLIIFV